MTNDPKLQMRRRLALCWQLGQGTRLRAVTKSLVATFISSVRKVCKIENPLTTNIHLRFTKKS